MNSSARTGGDALDGGDDPEMKLALDISLKEAQSLGIIATDAEGSGSGKDRDGPSSAGPGEEDGGNGSAGGAPKKNKRKRPTGELDENACVPPSTSLFSHFDIPSHFVSLGPRCPAFLSRVLSKTHCAYTRFLSWL